MNISLKQNIGFPSIGVGIMIIIGSLYGWMEKLPPLTTYPHELLISLVIGVGLIVVGFALTWPR